MLLGRQSDGSGWDLPGNFLNATDMIEPALQRECRREMDIEIEVGELLGAYEDTFRGMAIVTLVLAGVTLGLWFERKQRTLERFEARVAELRETTGAAGKLEEKVARLLAVSGYLIEEKWRRPQMVEILDEVTRRLPDEHWLISYSFRKGTVQLAGYSDDPSGVLLLLEQSELLSEAHFAAPVTLDPRIGKERFNIVATVAREDSAQ